ncbi:MAG: alpha/beta hydrolase [Novosphingobium sp.]|nr:alpha/beta hydrolase [Novosphingobium sp.]
MFDREKFCKLALADRELRVRLGRLDAQVRFGPDDAAMDLTIKDGAIVEVEAATAPEPDLIVAAPDTFWRNSLVARPGYGEASLTAGGARFEGDFARFGAPFMPAWEKLLVLMRKAACDTIEQHPTPPDRRETDDAVGRYAYVRNGEREARIFYETAGTGAVPLILYPTAGADSRQWRHLLTYPALRERFTMIAVDPPGHGKSLMPIGEPWWEQTYSATRDELMGWVTGLVDTLGLDRPVFMGCSVGGQLALSLAAFRAEPFRAFISMNGWLRSPPSMQTFDNWPYRDPATPLDYLMGRVLGTTSPIAPEDRRQETAWIYVSNAKGAYAGDNDYFMNAHDLARDGHLIDTAKTPLFVLAGEYDRTSLSDEDGAIAVPRYVPGAQYRLLKDLGHFAPSDDPELLCEALVPIMDEVLAACEEAGQA